MAYDYMGLHLGDRRTPRRGAAQCTSMQCYSMCLGVVLFKFAMSEDCPTALQGRKGLVKTKLSLDEDLTPTQ